MNVQVIATKSKKIMNSNISIIVILVLSFAVALLQGIMFGLGHWDINGITNDSAEAWRAWSVIALPLTASTFGTFGTFYTARLNPKFFWPEMIQNIFFFANAILLSLWFDGIMWILLSGTAIRMKVKWDQDAKISELKTRHINKKEILMTILFVVGLSLAVALPWRAFIPEGHPMYHPFPILDMFQLSLAVAGLYLGIKRICEMHLLYVISAFLGMIIYAMAGSFVMIVSIFGYLIVGSLSYFTWMAAIDKEV